VKQHILVLLAGIAMMAVVVGIVYFADRSDAQRDCYRFTREVKIVQACEGAKSCMFGPEDLRHIDRLQESCQGLGK
jgi:hypothetical protein